MKNKKNLIIIIVLVVALGIALFCIFKCKGKDKYTFDFFDGYTPGATYKGEINLKTGESDIYVIRGCSLLPENCPDDLEQHYTGKLEEKHLTTVKEILEKTNYKDNDWLILAVSNIIQGDKLCIDEEDDQETCLQLGEETLQEMQKELSAK